MDRGLDLLTGVLLVALMGVVLFGVADRFVLHLGAAWPEEIGRYLLIWVAFLASAIVVRRQEHFAVQFFVEKYLPPRLQRILRISHHLMISAVAFSFVLLGIGLVRIGADQISPGSGVPMSWVFAALPVSGLWLIYYALKRVLLEVNRPPTPGTDAAPAPENRTG